jgi:hypothetical protein
VLLSAELPALKQTIQAVRDFGGVPLPLSFRAMDTECPPIFDALIIDNETAAIELLTTVPARRLDGRIIVAGNDAARVALTKHGVPFKQILVPTTLSSIETLAVYSVRSELAKIAPMLRVVVREGAGLASHFISQNLITN